MLRHRPIAVAVVLGAALLPAACGGGTSGTTTGGSPASKGAVSNEVLHLAYQDDPVGGIDPDVFYSVEGASMILAMYEGLVRYAPDSTRLAPSLATAWKVSGDGLTYTFTLRRGVKFQDGTPFDARAVKANLERRKALKQPVSYMVQDVRSVTPRGRDTVVVRLARRNAAFLDLLASMYGPKMISPAALRAHAAGDHAMKWLSTHAAGTGPYRLASFQPGRAFVLQRFAGYWGHEPYFGGVNIAVVPDVGTQRIELQSGDLDLIPHGVAVPELSSLKGNSSLTVKTFPSLIRQVMLLNANKPPFDDPATRRAFAAALDVPQAVQQVYGQFVQAPRSAYPALIEQQPLSPLHPAPAPAPRSPRVKVTLTYTSTEPDLSRLAQYFQSTVKKAGFDVTVKGDTVAQEFGYASSPAQAPNAVISTYNPDSAHPDTWARPVWSSTGGLNLLGYKDAGLDGLLDRAAQSPTPAGQHARYDQVGARAAHDSAIVPLTDADDLMVARSNLTGFSHTPAYIWMVDLAALRRR